MLDSLIIIDDCNCSYYSAKPKNTFQRILIWFISKLRVADKKRWFILNKTPVTLLYSRWNQAERPLPVAPLYLPKGYRSVCGAHASINLTRSLYLNFHLFLLFFCKNLSYIHSTLLIVDRIYFGTIDRI